MEKDTFLTILGKSLNRLVNSDDRIIERNLNEVCINHRLANFLSEECNKKIFLG